MRGLTIKQFAFCILIFSSIAINSGRSPWRPRDPLLPKVGAHWSDEITDALASAKVALLLVTKDFLASEFIHEHELGPLLMDAERGGVQILWVLVRACHFKETPLKNYQAVIPPDRSLARMRASRDDAWVKICEVIASTVNR